MGLKVEILCAHTELLEFISASPQIQALQLTLPVVRNECFPFLGYCVRVCV